jgi:hypothetical protein
MEPHNDHSDIPGLDKFPTGNPFVVPEGYFDALRDSIEGRIRLGEKENVSNPFTVPENYFGKLPLHITHKINQQSHENSTNDNFFREQEEQIMRRLTLMDKAGDQPPFAVNPGYFETLRGAIEAKTSSKVPVKLNHFRKFTWAYAAAAVLVIAVGIAILNPQRMTDPVVLNPLSYSDSTALAMLANVSQTEIEQVLAKSDLSEEDIIRNIDPDKISAPVHLDEVELDHLIDEVDESDLLKAL